MTTCLYMGCVFFKSGLVHTTRFVNAISIVRKVWMGKDTEEDADGTYRTVSLSWTTECNAEVIYENIIKPLPLLYHWTVRWCK